LVWRFLAGFLIIICFAEERVLAVFAHPYIKTDMVLALLCVLISLGRADI
jgi:hypothetical protein